MESFRNRSFVIWVQNESMTSFTVTILFMKLWGWTRCVLLWMNACCSIKAFQYSIENPGIILTKPNFHPQKARDGHSSDTKLFCINAYTVRMKNQKCFVQSCPLKMPLMRLSIVSPGFTWGCPHILGSGVPWVSGARGKKWNQRLFFTKKIPKWFTQN